MGVMPKSQTATLFVQQLVKEKQICEGNPHMYKGYVMRNAYSYYDTDSNNTRTFLAPRENSSFW